MSFRVVFLIISTSVGVYIGYLMQRPVSSLCDSMECPYCYGNDLCGDIEENRINLRHGSFRELFYNVFSVKNVYFADYGGVKVVLKKLGHRNELDDIVKPTSITEDAILEYANSVVGGEVKNLRTCDNQVSKQLIDSLKESFSLEEIWTILRTNPEPFVLTTFKSEDDWPVPKLHGACGFLIVQQYCGLPLNHFRFSDWHVRVFLASQLLEAAVNFTTKHEQFRLYLTDISPDNVAVDDDFNLYFVDLENVILKQKLADDFTVHYSEYFDEEDFVYDEDAVCRSAVSDHNIYAVCRLLLSRRAPWPMMQDGLLHSPPTEALPRHERLSALIEECVDSERSRFHIAEELIRALKQTTP